MAGRHGNKGLFLVLFLLKTYLILPDNLHQIDIMLNPLGVPSRMNIGQVMELHLSMAARNLGIIATVLTDSSEDLWDTVREAVWIVMLRQSHDGRTGENHLTVCQLVSCT